MKRLLTASVLLASFAIAIPAYASTTAFFADFDEGGIMEFDLKKHDGRKKVTNFIWGKGIPMTCDDGESNATFGSSEVKARVKDGEFKLVTVDDGWTATIVGKFTSRHDAKGTLRQRGDIQGHTNCDTGKVHWTATDEN